MNLILIALILGIVAAEACAQYCIKQSNLTSNSDYFLIAVFCYTIVSLLLYATYNYTYIGLVNAIWSALSVLAIILVGVIFYHEYITMMDCLGILLIMIGIFCIFIYEH